MMATHRYRRILLVSLAIAGVVSFATADARAPSADRKLPDVLGVAHVNGAYHLSDGDFLNEGADRVLALGSRVIKLHLTLPPERVYPFNTTWPEVKTPVELARTPAFCRVFERPFTTYILTVYATGRGNHYWRRGVTDEEARDEERQFYQLATHFLTAYAGTGKTFVLQHWEGDWAIRARTDPNIDPTPEAINGMIRWLSARQAGVDRARNEIPNAGVRVFHAAEVNLVKIGYLKDRPTVTNRVLPHVDLDLVSYSAWDTQADAELFTRALDYIARHARDRAPFGDRNVYVGEFGQPENERTEPEARRVARDVVHTAVEWGCPYVVYWQVYCNEPRRRPVLENDDLRGFWLVRPDGSKAWAWGELTRMLRAD